MTRRFLRAERGSVALESAIALSVLVSGFSGLMNIVGDVYAHDQAGRGARAVARAIALDPSADPWAALKREVGLDASAACPEWPSTDFASAACDGWTLSVMHGVSPKSLAAASDTLGEAARFLRDQGTDRVGGTKGADGEVVLVRLKRGGSLTFGLARSEPRA